MFKICFCQNSMNFEFAFETTLVYLTSFLNCSNPAMFQQQYYVLTVLNSKHFFLLSLPHNILFNNNHLPNQAEIMAHLSRPLKPHFASRKRYPKVQTLIALSPQKTDSIITMPKHKHQFVNRKLFLLPSYFIYS